jgi:3-mercaptopyruvate sulfurtransferase SseA
VTRELQQAGWTHARALVGGWDAWLSGGRPTELRAAAPAAGGAQS